MEENVTIIFNNDITSSPLSPSDLNLTHGSPAILAQPPPPPPWYVHYLPEFIIVVGIVATVLTFYFSPELRNIIKRLRDFFFPRSEFIK
ncbi:MAG: hypothetical protein QXV69_09245 [Sulfolobaceae archaeon]